MNNHTRILHRLLLASTVLVGLLWLAFHATDALAAPPFYLDSTVDDLDRNVVLGLFTWHDTDPSFANREIDIEFSSSLAGGSALHRSLARTPAASPLESARWGNANDPSNGQYVVQPYDDPGNLVRFTQPQLLAQSTHLFDWRPDRRGAAPSNGRAVEVIVSRFEFVPAP